MHLRLIWKGRMILENALLIFEENTQTRLLSHSWLPRVCTDASAACLDASAPTRLPRRVCDDASAPTRPRRGVCTDASAPTGPGRRVCADASIPTGLRRRVCAAAPTRLHRRVCADASALACQNMDFRSKTLIPLETSSQNSKKHQAKSLVLRKVITPIAVAEIPR